MAQFIGDREVKAESVFEDGNMVELEFADGYKTKMTYDLYFKIKSDEKGEGNVTDHVVAHFAKLFLATLAENKLDYYFAETVGRSMHTLAHNLRERLLSKTFNCSGGDAIPLEKVIPE